MEDPGKISIRKDGLAFQFKGKALFETLIRSAFDLTKNSTSYSTLKSLWDSFEWVSNKERDAFMLIGKSLSEGFRDQIREELDQAHIDEQHNLVFNNRIMDTQAFRLIADKSYTIKLVDFKLPEQLPLLADFRPAYRQWLRDSFGMSAQRAEGLAAGFKYYFAYAYYGELRTDGYATFKTWLSDEHLPEQQRLLKRKRYFAQLREQYFRPSLGQQDVALSDIYIDPDFLVLDRLLSGANCDVPKKQSENRSPFLPTAYPSSIHDYVLEYFMKQRKSKHLGCEEERSRMMVLLGQPGHGKSSFCYRTAYDLLSREDFNGTVYFIRLCEVGKAVLQDPKSEYLRLLRREGVDPATDWANAVAPSLLLLDGLDELCMAQSLSDADVIELLQACMEMVKDHQQLFIIITSRFNYLPSDRLQRSNALVLSLATLNLTQQRMLIDKYNQRKGEVSKLDAEFLCIVNQGHSYDHIKELIELPILLQMVLIAGIDLRAVNSRAAIYGELFTQVLNRKWDQDGRLRKYADDNDFQPEHLRAYLAFLAFKIYQSPYAYLNRTQINNYPETEAFKREFLTGSDGAEGMDNLLKDVLTSFYLQEKHKLAEDEEEETRKAAYAIEFLHKSLYEYLACEHIWQKIKGYFLKSDGKSEYHRFAVVGEHLQRLLAHTRLSREMLGYLEEIISADTDCHAALQRAMLHTLPDMLEYGCLYRYPLENDGIPQRFTPGQQALHVFHGYWAILGNLRLQEMDAAPYFDSDWKTFHQRFLSGQSLEALVQTYGLPNGYDTGKALQTAWGGSQEDSAPQLSLIYQSHFRRVLYRAQDGVVGARLTEEVSGKIAHWLRMLSAERLLFGLRLRGITLVKADFAGLIASEIDWTGADLSGATIMGGGLISAIFSGANLSNANLESTYLSDSDFCSADLNSGCCVGAFLDDSNLRNVAFCKAELYGSNLNGADLWGSDLCGSDLRNADLRNAYFNNVNLQNVILSDPKQFDGIADKEVVGDKYTISDKEEKINTLWYGTPRGYIIHKKK